jgi:hypothetical protein
VLSLVSVLKRKEVSRLVREGSKSTSICESHTVEPA